MLSPPPPRVAHPTPSSPPSPRVAPLMPPPPPPPSRAPRVDLVALTTAATMGAGGGLSLDAAAEATIADQQLGNDTATTVAIKTLASAGAATTLSTKKVPLSATKRKAAGVKKGKKQPSKRLKSPTVPMSPLIPTRSTGIKMMVSPRVMSPSTTMAKSPSQAAKTPIEERSNLVHGSAHKNRRRKLTYEIWQDFEPIYDGQTISEAQCFHCQQIFKVNRDVGTSACLRHLRSCEGKARIDQMLNQMSSTDLSLTDTSIKEWKFDQERSRQELVKLIVVHALPFSLVEYPKFRTFVSSLNPWFKHVSRTTIKSDCIGYYEDGKVQLQNILNGLSSRVSLTADLWTSNQTLGYLCVTCHYISNEWTLKKRIIKFALVETPHDGRNLFNAMLKSLNEWNIEQRVFAITLDNASNNNSFVSFLKENLVAKRLLLSQGNLFHCRCAAHVLNLIVQEGLAAMSTAVSNIRDSVKYVKSSQARKQRFEKMIEDVGITCQKRPPLDVVTRWNSTYHMLSCAMEFKRTFESLTQEDTQYTHQPKAKEWDMAEKLCDILGKFCDATHVLSGSKYPTASLYFHQIWEIKLLLKRESTSKDVFVRSMVHEMQSKLQKYWDLSFLQICVPVILDPRFKLGFLEFRLRQGFGDSASTYFSLVEQTFRKLFDEYSLQWGHLTPEYAKPVEAEPNFGTNNPWADWGEQQNLNQRKRISELERYLGDETVPIDADFDILQYWKMSSATYPVLGCMARDILATPASTVASESAFSSGEKIINDYRSRLSSDTVQVLICLQDWMRGKGSSSTYDDIAGILIGDEEDNEI